MPLDCQRSQKVRQVCEAITVHLSLCLTLLDKCLHLNVIGSVCVCVFFKCSYSCVLFFSNIHIYMGEKWVWD